MQSWWGIAAGCAGCQLAALQIAGCSPRRSATPAAAQCTVRCGDCSGPEPQAPVAGTWHLACREIQALTAAASPGRGRWVQLPAGASASRCLGALRAVDRSTAQSVALRRGGGCGGCEPTPAAARCAARPGARAWSAAKQTRSLPRGVPGLQGGLARRAAVLLGARESGGRRCGAARRRAASSAARAHLLAPSPACLGASAPRSFPREAPCSALIGSSPSEPPTKLWRFKLGAPSAPRRAR